MFLRVKLARKSRVRELCGAAVPARVVEVSTLLGFLKLLLYWLAAALRRFFLFLVAVVGVWVCVCVCWHDTGDLPVSAGELRNLACDDTTGKHPHSSTKSRLAMLYDLRH